MTKPRKTNEGTLPPELLAPISVTQTESEKAKELTIDVPPGHVYIVGLNADGTEKENSGFFYPERSYKRIYVDKTKYSVKKKSTLTILNNHHYETLHRSSQQIAFSAHRRCNSCGG